MKKTNQSFSFLAQSGLFRRAHLKISDQTFEELLSSYNEAILNGNKEDALLIAEKMSIQYGLSGLHHYFKVKLECLRAMIEKGEIIDQEVIKVLSLILYVSNTSSQDELSKLQSEFLSLIDNKDQGTALDEARGQCEYYLR